MFNFIKILSVRKRGGHQGKVVLLYKVSMLPLIPAFYFSIL